MKFSEQWLREWVNPPLSTVQLSEQLTLAGLEVDHTQSVAGEFNQVVVGQVRIVMPHPDADRLRVCQVDVGEENLLNIVCGASNVAVDQKVAVAKIDAVLPGNFKIKKSKLRGVESYGMICSESELGLAETSNGIMVLSPDAPIGVSLRDYLQLDDVIFDIELTPNRGDCLSIRGIAREVSALNKITMQEPPIAPLVHTIAAQVPVTIKDSCACPHYLGRVIRNINPHAQTPPWLQEKLRRSGIRPLYPVVDVTNYVLLELGQPLHAFDLAYLPQGIEVRFAHENETIELLDEQKLSLTSEALVITDGQHPIALAGIKGGKDSAITEKTTAIFLESALFNASVIAKTARRYGIFTDSSHRYERGVDFELQQLAIERASALILSIAGGEVGAIIAKGERPAPMAPILLRSARIPKILGISLSNEEIHGILDRLGMKIEAQGEGWFVIPPSYRHDITLEIDLIEELARIYGYDKIPAQKMNTPSTFLPVPETKLDWQRIRTTLIDSGYHEAITYSFVDPRYEKTLGLQAHPLAVVNPISSELATMRTNHWPGLIQTFQYNYHRQQPRVRLFETGLCFLNHSGKVSQELHLGGLCSGSLFADQWGESKRAVDFFDIKADVEKILALVGKDKPFTFETCEHPALHPGQSAIILLEEKIVGTMGALHPNVAQDFDINQILYLFDLNLDSIMDVSLPKYEILSKFPAIKRDLALVVSTQVQAGKVKQKILDSKGELLKRVHIFDIYQGQGIEAGKKSIALSLTFQHISRTLVDAEINDFMQNIIQIMHKDFNATLRD